ncbi:hypothetical protein [Curtobacterium sp. PhB146]|uniref:hypothetical protein n=1 Tax=Curtobacterium sp. PhB146 TaxID=2485187 RepID=UPI0010E505A0|nr:hypothetical protein [Curtobacterium sp. PhB146]TCU48350.1 hypothetical protein EDF33_102241 [Curtobacterium sp. PhB146]
MPKIRTFADGQPLSAADLNAGVPDVPNDGDVLDTGWVTSGLVAAAGITLGTYRIRRIGMQVLINLDPFTVDSLVVPVSGDIGNRAVCTVADAFKPKNVQALSSASTGRVSSGYINGAGTVALAATTPTATQTANLTLTNNQFSLGGSYFLG